MGSSGWPVPNGTKHFEAITSDRRPIDIQFSGGWLTVTEGPKSAPLDSPEMREILCVRIAPWGTLDIRPDQVCDILGITVNGNRIDSAGTRTAARGFDWSGQTTYWESTHLMQPKDDASAFVQKLVDAFPGSTLIQPEWGSGGRARCRQIEFLSATDEVIALGVGPNPALFHKMLAGEKVSWEEFDNIFAFRIDFVRDDRMDGDPTGATYIHDEAMALNLTFDVIHHRRYRIRAEYPTADADAQSRVKTLVSLIDASFVRGLKVDNLQTGAVITESLADDADKRTYSSALRDEWLRKQSRYFFVGKAVSGDDFGWEPGIFWGARPPQKVRRFTPERPARAAALNSAWRPSAAPRRCQPRRFGAASSASTRHRGSRLRTEGLVSRLMREYVPSP